MLCSAVWTMLLLQQDFSHPGLLYLLRRVQCGWGLDCVLDPAGLVIVVVIVTTIKISHPLRSRGFAFRQPAVEPDSCDCCVCLSFRKFGLLRIY